MTKNIKLLFLFLAFVLLSVQVFAFTLELPTQVEQVKMLQELFQNKQIQSQLTNEQLNNFNLILVELENQSIELMNEQNKPNQNLEEFGNLLEDQLNGLILLDQQVQILLKDNESLTISLAQLSEIISNLKWDLEVALDKVNDAEIGAISLLDENQELYEQNKALEAFVDSMRIDIAKMEKRTAIQPWIFFGGVGIGITGTAFLTDGIINEDLTKVTTGTIIIGVDVAIYLTGRYLFKWW